MSANPLTFNFSNHSIRVVMIDNIPWFVAVDVCAVLKIVNSRRAVSRLDDDEKGVRTMNTSGGDQQLSIINESGLYSLILTSRKPEARNFKKWVTAEVLPALRRHGKYEMPNAAAAPFITLTKDDFVDLIQGCVTATLRAERAVAGSRSEQLELSDWGKGEALRLYKNGVSAVEIAWLINRPVSAVNDFLSQNRCGGKTYN